MDVETIRSSEFTLPSFRFNHPLALYSAETFSGPGTVYKPIITIASFRGTILLFANYYATITFLRAVTSAFGRLAAVEAGLGAEDRAGIGRIGREAEEIVYVICLDSYAPSDLVAFIRSGLTFLSSTSRGGEEHYMTGQRPGKSWSAASMCLSAGPHYRSRRIEIGERKSTFRAMHATLLTSTTFFHWLARTDVSPARLYTIHISSWIAQ